MPHKKQYSLWATLHKLSVTLEPVQYCTTKSSHMLPLILTTLAFKSHLTWERNQNQNQTKNKLWQPLDHQSSSSTLQQFHRNQFSENCFKNKNKKSLSWIVMTHVLHSYGNCQSLCNLQHKNHQVQPHEKTPAKITLRACKQQVHCNS